MKMLTEYGPLIGRILLALLFVISGVGKLLSWEGTASYMELSSIPSELLPLVILLEIVAGMAIILGWHTKIAALCLAVFTLLTALLFHMDFGNELQMAMFMKNLAITGALLLLMSMGPGMHSMDNRQH